MKESVKDFCRLNGIEASDSLPDALFNTWMESVANDDREYTAEFNNAKGKEQTTIPAGTA
jgi:hypothetical protein